MHVKYIQDNFASYDIVHQYVRDNGHELTIHVNFMVKCVYYTGLRSNGCFMADGALTVIITRRTSLVVWATQGRT
jgi:hypothetical protein